MLSCNLALPAAFPAQHPQRSRAGLHLRALCHCSFRQHVQIHLHALGDNPCKWPHAQANGPDADRILFLRSLQGNIQYMFCDRKLVHGFFLLHPV